MGKLKENNSIAIAVTALTFSIGGCLLVSGIGGNEELIQVGVLLTLIPVFVALSGLVMLSLVKTMQNPDKPQLHHFPVFIKLAQLSVFVGSVMLLFGQNPDVLIPGALFTFVPL